VWGRRRGGQKKEQAIVYRDSLGRKRPPKKSGTGGRGGISLGGTTLREGGGK